MDVAEVFVELVSRTLLFEELLDCLDALAPAFEDGDDVASGFHGDDAHVIFLVDPDEELSALCAEDAAAIRPVTSCTSSCKECRACRFLEEIAVATELVSHGLRH